MSNLTTFVHNKLEPKVPIREHSALKYVHSKFVLACLIFFIINVLAVPGMNRPTIQKPIDFSSSDKELHTVGKVTSWWLAKAYFAEPKPPDVVILGTSQVGSLLNADAYVYDRRIDITGNHRSYTIEHDFRLLLHKDWKAIVLGFPGAMISDQLILSNALFSKKYHPKLVVLTISPRDFVDNMCQSTTSSEVFAFFSKYVRFEPKVRSIFTPRVAHLHDLLSFVPLRTTGQNFLQLDNYNFSSRSNDRMVPLPLKNMVVPFERVIQNQNTIGSGDLYYYRDNTRDYKKRYKNPFPEQLKIQLHCLDLLFEYLSKQGISASVVEMPLTYYNRVLLPESFWYYYKAEVNKICRKHNVDYWDTRSIWDDLSILEFCDSVHLNLHGGLKMTRPIVLATAYKFHFPMYAYYGNFGPLVPGKEKIYFHKTWGNVPSKQ